MKLKFGTVVFSFVAVMLVAQNRLLYALDEPTAEELIDLHDNSLRAIHSGILELQVQGLHKSSGQLRDSFAFRWIWTGSRRRITVQHLQTRVSQAFPRLRRDDILVGDNDCRYLYNYEPDGSVRIDPGDQNGVAGTIGSSANLTMLDPSRYCLLGFSLSNDAQFNSLRELSRRMKTPALIGFENGIGWHLRFDLEEKLTDLEPERIDVWIDPSKGFRVVQAEKRFKLDNGEMVSSIKAVDFKRFAEGVFLPVVCLESIAVNGETPALVGRFTLEVESLNSPVEESLFSLEFPENLYVADTRSANPADAKWYLWGSDGQPAIELSDPSEYQGQYLSSRKTQDRSRSTRFWSILFAVNVLAIALLVFLVRRRTRRGFGQSSF